ncbi:MAG: hypothetical protein IIB53_10890 [Planctomycetes bacterium]|nr:hypothetical protein [Planctomycetota bacterium]
MLFGFSPAQPKKITARYFAPTFDVRRSTFDVRRSTFDVRRSTFDVRRSTFDVRRSTFDVHDGRYGIACVLGGLVRKFSLPGAVWSTL